jgi:hypothetical protein
MKLKRGAKKRVSDASSTCRQTEEETAIGDNERQRKMRTRESTSGQQAEKQGAFKAPSACN